MGDVALLTPVIRAMREQFPEVEITLLTRKAFSPFFDEDGSIDIFTPDFKGRHKGPAGILRLYSDISMNRKFDHIIDLHDVIRTSVLRKLFLLKGTPVSVIDKGRCEKRRVIKGKVSNNLRHTVERYLDVFREAGYELKTVPGPFIRVGAQNAKKAGEVIGTPAALNIGVAPFAKHQLKMWPEENMIKLLNLVAAKYDSRFWLFGGSDEAGKIEEFIRKIPSAISLCGIFLLSEELALIGKLDLMIAMDSSNMHMAAMMGTPVISIWGGTDPVTGFGAWMQPDDYSIRISSSDLSCRPCTIYGKGTCRRGDLACMNWLTPEIVFRKIEKTGLLDLKKR
jgi:ADP-heptose:LPS heptosyltransferase